MKPLSLAYSPCPNDTFIFCAIANGLIDLCDLSFDIHLADVEHLNVAARQGQYDITKLSIAAFPYVQDKYGLLWAGSALGRGCGPIIVAKPGRDITDLPNASIAVPGMMTTAYLLLCLFQGKAVEVGAISFDRIMPAVSQGQYDFGVIIHEGRFTFKDYGLVKVVDLGQWWEQQTGLPLPLGGIAIKRDFGAELAKTVDSLICNSLKYAWANPDHVMKYVTRHAQEMKPHVISQHIDLYVNQYSLHLGEEGARAIETLLAWGAKLGILPRVDLSSIMSFYL